MIFKYFKHKHSKENQNKNEILRKMKQNENFFFN